MQPDVRVLFESAMSLCNLGAQTNWPEPAIRVQWVNDALHEFQALTGWYKPWINHTFTASANYEDILTERQDPELIKLVDVWVGQIQQALFDDVAIIWRMREEGVVNTPSELDYRSFALHLRPPDADEGTVRVEVYPAFTANTVVKLRLAMTPPLATNETSIVNAPARIISRYLAHLICTAWEGKAAQAPMHYALFKQACASTHSNQAVRGALNQAVVMGGFHAQQGDSQLTFGRRYGR